MTDYLSKNSSISRTATGWTGLTAQIERHAKDSAVVSGIILRATDCNDEDLVRMAPITLFPSPFPRNYFETAVTLQPVINDMMHRVAYDDTFLLSSLQSLCKVDEFNGRLMRIHTTCSKEGFAQDVSLGLLRSDYMIDRSYGESGHEELRMKQVEVNTIAAGFGGLGPRIGQLHENILLKCGHSKDALMDKLPSNGATREMLSLMVESWNLYGRSDASILFLVENTITINIADQKIFELELNMLRPDIMVIRRTFSEIVESAVLDGDRALRVDGIEVGVVYFRYGYSPDHYPSSQYWDIRLLIERSRAIKCPSIRYQLAGAKKIQQILANRQQLEKFVSNSSHVDLMMSVTSGLWGLELDSIDGDDAVRRALSSPHKYVLKPQREGGGNNFYGNEILQVLAPISNSIEREKFILMDLIRQPTVDNYLLISGHSHDPTQGPQDIVSELGIFGGIVGSKSWTLANRQTGHVLRSKQLGVMEGGIAAGYGAIDSPYLV